MKLNLAAANRLRKRKMTKNTLILTLVGSILFTACANAEEDFSGRAVELVKRYPLVDTHIDVPYRIHNSWADVTGATDGGDYDYPRARAGGLDVPFMSIYTPASSEVDGSSHQLAHELIDGVEAMVTRAPDKYMMTHSVSDVHEARKQGKIGLALGMENGSPIAGNLET